MGNLFLLIRSVITGAMNRDISRLPEILQPFRQSAVTYTEILSTATNTKLFMIKIVLDWIQFKPFVMLLCIMRSSFKTILLLYHLLLIGNLLILTCTIFILAAACLWMSTGRMTSKRTSAIGRRKDGSDLLSRQMKGGGHTFVLE